MGKRRPAIVELRLGPRMARISRWFNFLLGLLALQWRWKPEGELTPDGGRRFLVDRETLWIGRIVLAVALAAALAAFWWLVLRA